MPRPERPARPLPFPDSLCHRCSAPPKLVEGKNQTFLLCPRLPELRYPPQPVRTCELFTPIGEIAP